MSFLDPIFFLFLPVVYIPYLIFFKKRWSLHYLVAASLFFYGFHRPEHVILLLFASVFTFIAAYWVGNLKGEESSPFGAGSAVLVATLFLMTPLFIYKYYNFFMRTLIDLRLISSADFLALALPPGISFFTFQCVSYVTDVYRGSVSHSKSLLSVNLYISFFPQLVAGPIVHASEFIPQIRERRLPTPADLNEAFFYLISGYLKKGVLADTISPIVDRVYADPSAYGWQELVVVLIGYSLQIYFDFSGYSDIAIGLGKMFAIRLPENFHFPYASPGFQDFWRRWHITLSSWLRDHIYIPLGGSRRGESRTVLALLATMLIGGLWHGAHWNYILWGGAHGLLLVLERRVPKRLRTMPEIRHLYIAVTFAVTTLLWVPFRAGMEREGFSLAMTIFERLFTFAQGRFNESDARIVLSFTLLMVIVFFVYERLKKKLLSGNEFASALVYAVAAISITVLSPGSGSFIYFVF